MSAAPPPAWRWRDEWRDFLAFLRRPRLGPRLPRPCVGPLTLDWLGGVQWSRLWRWAALLWAINLIVLGPLVASIASGSGTEHRLLDTMVVPWALALLWAPLVEELMFRYGLRRPGAALWLVPAFVGVVWWGAGLKAGAALAFTFLLLAWGRLPLLRWSFVWRRRYVRVFPIVFYLATLAFAMLHLLNYRLGTMVLWLLPVLVLPQFVTGLVLGWLRVRSGIGAAIVLHALFNAGPMVLLWLLLQASALA